MLNVKNYEMDYNVGKIVFYNNGKKIEVSTSSYIQEVYSLENGCFTRNWMEKLISINPGQEFKRAIKENLNRKDCYYMTYSEKYSSVKKTALYIFAEFEVSEAIDHIWENETAYINAVRVKIPAEYEITISEKLQYDPEFKLPEGARWYSTYDKNNNDNTYKVVDLTESKFAGYHEKKGNPLKYINHLTRRIEEKEEILLKVGPYTRIEYSEKRKNADKIADKFNDILGGSNFSHYQIEKLLEHFNITEK